MPKLAIILGPAHAGTSLLCAMVGRHPEINMLLEPSSLDILNGYGKEYNAGKYIYWLQIRQQQRASVFGHVINRIYRCFPLSKLSIADFRKLKAKVIVITRDWQKVRESMLRRQKVKMSADAIDRYISRCHDLFDKDVVGDDVFYTTLETLNENKEKVLKDICVYLGLDFDERMLDGDKYNLHYPEYVKELKSGQILLKP
jgi:hypothetical protein